MREFMLVMIGVHFCLCMAAAAFDLRLLSAIHLTMATMLCVVLPERPAWCAAQVLDQRDLYPREGR